MRALIWRLLSRMGCAFTELIAAIHSRADHQIFRAPWDADVANKLANATECVLGPWVHSLLKRYPAFGSDALRQILYTVAYLTPVDISVVESLNALLRRILNQFSLQTHRMEFEDLSNRFSCAISRSDCHRRKKVRCSAKEAYISEIQG